MDIQAYQVWRKSLVELHKKILKTLPENTIPECARILGLLQNRTVVLDDEDQIQILMDLAIYEPVLPGNHSAFDLYMAAHKPESDIEEELLNAMTNSRTSLFEITEVHPHTHQLVYEDLLDPSTGKVIVTDINFSQTAQVGIVVFTRIVPVPNCSLTSGAAFPFSGELKKYLIRRHKVVMKKLAFENANVRRYAAFFRLNRSEGLPTTFEQV